MLKNIFLLLTGAAAGFINGFLGTGGGIIIIFLLTLSYPHMDPRDRFATAVASIFPMSLVSAGFYLKKGSFAINEVFPYILPALIGGLVGGILLSKIKVSLLKKIFACLLIYAGVVMNL